LKQLVEKLAINQSEWKELMDRTGILGSYCSGVSISLAWSNKQLVPAAYCTDLLSKDAQANV